MLVYFKKCLHQWVKLYFGKDARKRHFTFMQAKGSMVKDWHLKINEYAFCEAIYLYNEIGDFLWDDPTQSILKLSESELKRGFFRVNQGLGVFSSWKAPMHLSQKICCWRNSSSISNLRRTMPLDASARILKNRHASVPHQITMVTSLTRTIKRSPVARTRLRVLQGSQSKL